MLKRIWKDELYKAMQIYERELSEFIYKPMTPATIERMKYKIEATRHKYRAMDRNYVWDVKIEIISTSPGTFELRPVISDDMILDEKPRIPF